MMRTRMLTGALVALAAIVPALVASAQGGGPVPTAGKPLAPAVAFANRANTHMLVWAEDKGGGTGLDLYAVRLSATGVRIGSEIEVLVGPGNQSDPGLIYNERLNQFLLVYTDDSGGAAGDPGRPTPVLPPIPGPTAPPLPPIPMPALPDGLAPGEGGAPDREDSGASAGGVLVPPHVVVPAGSVSTDSEVIGDRAMAFDAEGSPRSDNEATYVLGEPIGIGSDLPNQPPPPPPPPGTPAPTAPPPPGATAGPPAPPPVTPGSRDIYGTWLTTYGLRTTNTFAIVSAPSDDTYPDITYYTTGSIDQYVLVWREVNGVDVQIVSSRLRGSGYFFIVDAKRNVVMGADLGRPSIAAEAASGEYLVAWAQTPKDGAERNIHARQLNSNGVPYKPVFALADGVADEVYPSLASLGAFGGYLAVWEQRLPGEPPDIQTRRLNFSGRPYRTSYALAGGAQFSFAPDVATSGATSTLVVWLDRNAAGDHSVLAAEVSRQGRRLGPERVVVSGGMGPGGVTPVVPGPGFPTPPGPPIP